MIADGNFEAKRFFFFIKNRINAYLELLMMLVCIYEFIFIIAFEFTIPVYADGHSAVSQTFLSFPLLHPSLEKIL
jgi:hypothetical protein